jgi:hypothetical protein
MTALSFLGWSALLWGLAQGLGRLALRISGHSGQMAWAAWVGVSLAPGVLAAMHLFWPMAREAGVALVAMALLGWGLGRPRGREWRLVLLEGCGTTLVAIVFGWGAVMGMVLQRDWGVYLQQAQRWAVACPVVPGLGNLHPWLALPGSGPLLAGLLDHGAGDPWGARLLGGVLWSLAIVSFSGAWWTARRERDRARRGFCLAALSLLAGVLLAPELPVASSDVWGAILALVLVFRSWSFLRGDSRGVAILLSSLVGLVLIKPSAVVVAPFLVFLLVRRGWRPLPAELGLWGTLAVASLAHNAITSGWVLFPFGGRWTPFDWTVPEAVASTFADTLRGGFWMAPSGDPRGIGWRLTSLGSHPEVRAMGAMLGVFALGWFLGRRSSILAPAWRGGGIVLVCAGALVVWWFATSDLRVARALLWVGAALVAAWLYDRTERRWVRGLVLVAVLFSTMASLREAATRYTKPLNPGASVRSMELPSGLRVWTPVSGEREVWSAPLPATSDSSDIEARGPNLCDGFRPRRKE